MKKKTTKAPARPATDEAFLKQWLSVIPQGEHTLTVPITMRACYWISTARVAKAHGWTLAEVLSHSLDGGNDIMEMENSISDEGFPEDEK